MTRLPECAVRTDWRVTTWEAGGGGNSAESLESLALVLARGERFCTVDRAARRPMQELGVVDRWVALEELQGTLEPPVPVPDDKYRERPRG
ncbi:MAG: hypothetical protein Q8Q85_15195 [Gemmatimonadales bacterium]|nr:hypothetical protein [Gemmatimonadales bacterium]